MAAITVANLSKTYRYHRKAPGLRGSIAGLLRRETLETHIDNLGTFFYSLFGTARFPVAFFKGLLHTVLTFVFPVAFATTFPTEALRGQADMRLLPIGLTLAAAGLPGTHLFWNYAVRHYSSASS